MDKGPQKTIKVMSYNIRRDRPVWHEIRDKNSWYKRRKGLTAQILRYSPDLLGVQEANPSQAAYLTKNLHGYKMIKLGRDGKDRGEACAIFYKPERFELISNETFWLSQTPDVPSNYPGTICKRICTYIVAKDKLTSKTFCYLNTHLDNRVAGARMFGAEKICQKIASFDCPIILSGDFNDTEQSKAYNTVAAILNDSAKVAADSKEHGSFHDFTGKARQYPIDFIFVSKNISVNRYGVIVERGEKAWHSDHYPVFAEIEM
ncbi:MAG TPA: endonuclease/exonuclease/phosphatase family protein [Clostridia bacterium]|jgi:endonuclease/exonuclease/phosphatase family metal-dependent hydrolase|nr:endonuclease/exonuclease/phosphatase family protein [Clostridia bacterium]HOL61202.1 endonuclease/exonuclease/phosphatase family protein [Clostridia bacterium]HPO53880.1 endonuclease/exonuclease/phosphatase family protein [Clostridia bacterium]